MTHDFHIRRPGFTLLEVLVVMTILAVIVTLVIGLGRYTDLQAKRHRALADLAIWHDALHQYYLKTGEYPGFAGATSASNLAAVVTPISATVSVRLQDGTTSSATLTNRFLDPWNHAYVYVAATNAGVQSYDLYSQGPDAGNDSDDIRFK